MEAVKGLVPIEALLSNEHGVAVILVEGRWIVALNDAARTLLGVRATQGVELSLVLDDRSRDKLERAGALAPWSAVELQVRTAYADVRPVRFLVATLAGGLLLIGSAAGMGYTEAMARTL